MNTIQTILGEDDPTEGENITRLLLGADDDFSSMSLPTVRRGDSGPAVRLLQMRLVSRIGASNVDGSFGPLTYASVRAFQDENGLTSDGVVGPQTWAALTAGIPMASIAKIMNQTISGYILGDKPMNGYLALAHQRTILGDADTNSGSGGGGLIPGIFDFLKQGTLSVLKANQDKSDADKAAGDSAAALQAAISADQRAKDALAKALVSENAKSSSAAADRIAADMALQDQDSKAQGLSSENQKKRAEAARTALEKATSEWQTASAGKNTASAKIKEMWVKAAQQIYAKTQNNMLVSAANTPGGLAQMQKPATNDNFFTRKHAGVPTWGWGLGFATITGVVVLAIKKRH